jgi:hypothetical protein
MHESQEELAQNGHSKFGLSPKLPPKPKSWFFSPPKEAKVKEKVKKSIKKKNLYGNNTLLLK